MWLLFQNHKLHVNISIVLDLCQIVIVLSFCLFVFIWKALLWPQQCPTAYVFHRCLHLMGHFRDNKTPQQAFIPTFKEQFENKQPRQLKLFVRSALTEALINGAASKESLWSVSQTSVDYWSTYWGILQSCYGLTEVSWAPHSVLIPQTPEQTQFSGRKWKKEKLKQRSGEGGGEKLSNLYKKEKSGLEIAFQTTGKESLVFVGLFSQCKVVLSYCIISFAIGENLFSTRYWSPKLCLILNECKMSCGSMQICFTDSRYYTPLHQLPSQLGYSNQLLLCQTKLNCIWW